MLVTNLSRWTDISFSDFWHKSVGNAGTAVGVCPVGSLTYQGQKTTFVTGETPGPVCQKLYDALIGIQTKQKPDIHGWVIPLDKMPELAASLS
jgi:hypothetical protein